MIIPVLIITPGLLFRCSILWVWALIFNNGFMFKPPRVLPGTCGGFLWSSSFGGPLKYTFYLIICWNQRYVTFATTAFTLNLLWAGVSTIKNFTHSPSLRQKFIHYLSTATEHATTHEPTTNPGTFYEVRVSRFLKTKFA